MLGALPVDAMLIQSCFKMLWVELKKVNHVFPSKQRNKFYTFQKQTPFTIQQVVCVARTEMSPSNKWLDFSAVKPLVFPVPGGPCTTCNTEMQGGSSWKSFENCSQRRRTYSSLLVVMMMMMMMMMMMVMVMMMMVVMMVMMVVMMMMMMMMMISLTRWNLEETISTTAHWNTLHMRMDRNLILVNDNHIQSFKVFVFRKSKILLPFVPSIYLNLSSFQLLCEDLSHFDTPKAQSQTVQVCVRAAFRALLRSPRVFPPNGAPQGWHYVLQYHSSHLPPKPAVMSWFFDIGIVVCAYNQAPNHINKFRKPLQLAQLHSRLCDGFRFSTCGCSKRVAVWCNSCRAPLEVSF